MGARRRSMGNHFSQHDSQRFDLCSCVYAHACVFYTMLPQPWMRESASTNQTLTSYRTNFWRQVDEAASFVLSERPHQISVEIMSGYLHNGCHLQWFDNSPSLHLPAFSASFQRAIIVSIIQRPPLFLTATLMISCPTFRPSWKRWRHQKGSIYNYCKRCLNTEPYLQQVLQGTSRAVESRFSPEVWRSRTLAWMASPAATPGGSRFPQLPTYPNSEGSFCLYSTGWLVDASSRE